MTYVVTKPCLGTKDRSCVEVCPVDCFYDIKKKSLNEKYGMAFEGDDDSDSEEHDNAGMLVIHPDQCINCGACETECPVEAIYEDSAVPDDMTEFTQLNEDLPLNLTDDELAACNCTAKM
jgi:ferredoxin